MKIKSVVVLVTVMFVLVYAANAQPSEPINIALIADKAAGLDKSPLLSLLEVGLSQIEDVKLLE